MVIPPRCARQAGGFVRKPFRWPGCRGGQRAVLYKMLKIDALLVLCSRTGSHPTVEGVQCCSFLLNLVGVQARQVGSAPPRAACPVSCLHRPERGTPSPPSEGEETGGLPVMQWSCGFTPPLGVRIAHTEEVPQHPPLRVESIYLGGLQILLDLCLSWQLARVRREE